MLLIPHPSHSSQVLSTTALVDELGPSNTERSDRSVERAAPGRFSQRARTCADEPASSRMHLRPDEPASSPRAEAGEHAQQVV